MYGVGQRIVVCHPTARPIGQGVAGGDAAAARVGAVKATGGTGADGLAANKARERACSDRGVGCAIVGFPGGAATGDRQRLAVDGHGMGRVVQAVIAGHAASRAIGQGVADRGAAAAGVGAGEHAGAAGGHGLTAHEAAQGHGRHCETGARVIGLAGQCGCS